MAKTKDGFPMSEGSVVISLDFPGGVITAKYPAGTVGGAYRYWVESIDGSLKGESVVDALVSDAIIVQRGATDIPYNAFAARLDSQGNELAGSRITKQFIVAGWPSQPGDVDIDVPNAMSISVDGQVVAAPPVRRG